MSDLGVEGDDTVKAGLEGTTTHPPIGTEIADLEIQVSSHDLSIVLWYPEEEASDAESFCAPVCFEPFVKPCDISNLLCPQLAWLYAGPSRLRC